jgi:hypothetical protein
MAYSVYMAHDLFTGRRKGKLMGCTDSLNTQYSCDNKKFMQTLHTEFMVCGSLRWRSVEV